MKNNIDCFFAAASSSIPIIEICLLVLAHILAKVIIGRLTAKVIYFVPHSNLNCNLLTTFDQKNIIILTVMYRRQLH